MSHSAPPLRMNADLFVPSNGELVIRDIISDGSNIPTETYRKTGHLRRPATMGGQRFGKLSMSSFFTRHNPHPKRVHHFKGLLDVPICGVYDVDKNNKSYEYEWPPNNYVRSRLPTECLNVNTSQYPQDTLTGLHYGHPLKNLPFGHDGGQTQPTISSAGEDSEPWRKELQKIAAAAGLSPRDEKLDKKPESRRSTRYSVTTGRLIPAPSRGLTRGRTSKTPATAQQKFLEIVTAGQGRPLEEGAAVENTVMTMLCQILQTENVEAVQDWLSKAGEQEKGMVGELITAAMTGSEQGYQTQYPVQEYLVNLDGSPMTPDIGNTIGDNVQNRLSTADDQPPILEPAEITVPRKPPSPSKSVDEIVHRICAETPDQVNQVQMLKNSPLPPIRENTEELFEQKSLTQKTPLPDILKVTDGKPEQSKAGFNAALENVTRKTLETLSVQRTDPNLKKFTKYPITQPTEEEIDIRMAMTSAMSNRLKTAEKKQIASTSWQPQASLPTAVA